LADSNGKIYQITKRKKKKPTETMTIKKKLFHSACIKSLYTVFDIYTARYLLRRSVL